MLPMIKKWKALICLTLLAAMLLSSCQKETESDLPLSESSSAEDAPATEPESETTATGTDTTIPEPESTAEPETEPETTPAPETTAEPETTSPPETLADFNIGTVGESTAYRLTDNFINMLTGEAADKETYYRRPVAIMINNLKKSTPQAGVSEADILYECVVEGGITRLMMVVNDYSALNMVGSIRSSREYYLDFAANHDAIYVHAGGSTQAYAEIQGRKISNLDGVNMYVPDMFFRDANRQKTMGQEHSLMTDGTRIANGIEFKKYRTTVRDTFTSSFQFVDYNESPLDLGGSAAEKVTVTYNGIYKPYYTYDASTGLYKRFQFDAPHIDANNNEQLTFTNILILSLKHTFTGDEKGHMDVDSVGSGDGYYVSGGKYIPIKWSKASEDTPMVLTNTDGSQLLLNCGKTAVNIVSASVLKGVKFE